LSYQHLKKYNFHEAPQHFSAILSSVILKKIEKTEDIKPLFFNESIIGPGWGVI